MFERIPFLQLAAEERSSEGGDDDDDMQVRRWLVNILILNIGWIIQADHEIISTEYLFQAEVNISPQN